MWQPQQRTMKWEKSSNEWLESVEQRRSPSTSERIYLYEIASINLKTCRCDSLCRVYIYFSALILQLSLFFAFFLCVIRLVVDSCIMLSFLSDKCEYYYCTKDSLISSGVWFYRLFGGVSQMRKIHPAIRTP